MRFFQGDTLWYSLHQYKWITPCIIVNKNPKQYICIFLKVVRHHLVHIDNAVIVSFLRIGLVLVWFCRKLKSAPTDQEYQAGDSNKSLQTIRLMCNCRIWEVWGYLGFTLTLLMTVTPHYLHWLSLSQTLFCDNKVQSIDLVDKRGGEWEG